MSHFDYVKEPPTQGKVITSLAKSDLYPHQAFRIDGHIMTTQAHPEMIALQVICFITNNRPILMETLCGNSKERYEELCDSVSSNAKKAERAGMKFMKNFYHGPTTFPSQLDFGF
jgi:GMP synthase-like glutamine amidotransferase